jgi:hypothetical protein
VEIRFPTFWILSENQSGSDNMTDQEIYYWTIYAKKHATGEPTIWKAMPQKK